MPKLIPFGDRILVKRKEVGVKASEHIFLPDDVGERKTDLAVVIYVPESNFIDKLLIDKMENIVCALGKKAQMGDSGAVDALLDFNNFLKVKTIKEGDQVMISKYVGTDFHATGETETLTLVKSEDIIGLVKDE